MRCSEILGRIQSDAILAEEPVFLAISKVDYQHIVVGIDVLARGSVLTKELKVAVR